MRAYYPIITSFLIATLFSILIKWLLGKVNNLIWQNAVVGIIAKYLPFLVILFSGCWILGIYFELNYFRLIGSIGTASIIFANLILIITLPLSWLVDGINRLISRLRPSQSIEKSSFSAERRQVIKTAAAAFPLLALGTTGTGLARSFESVQVNKTAVYFPNLPSELDGFKILHLSDLHLGLYFQLDDLECVIEKASEEKPDMFLITGDVSDNLNILSDALNLIHQLKTPHNGYISLGNHEYYRGLTECVRKFILSPISLLVNQSQIINIGDSKLFIGGIDDPVTLKGNVLPVLKKSIKKTMKNSPTESFKILMSHRPRALDVGDEFGIDLIFSGHTHGGQVGFNGRSLFEGMIEKEPYLWGKYKKGKTQLYTSAGMGHWFPFRLNCPAEAPIIVLKKGKAA